MVNTWTNSRGSDIYVVPPDPDASARPLIVGPYHEYCASIHPSGKWIAYNSNESGREEVYVRPYPNIDDGKWLVSTAGGWAARWSNDGSELFYRQAEKFIRVGVQADTTFRMLDQEVLFEGPYFNGGPWLHYYDISPIDGRFLLLREDARATELAVVENWFEELRRRAPVEKN